MAKVEYLWRRNNKHNMTIVSNPANQELFPIDKVIVGRYTYGGLHVVPYNDTDGQLVIGNYCSIAKNVKFLLGGNHDYKRVSTYPFKLYTEWDGVTSSKGDIIIDDDVWICENCLVLSGVRIGQGAVVAANTVVTKDVKPYEIVGVNPMRHIKYRFTDDIINKLKTVNYSSIYIQDIQRNRNFFIEELNSSNINQLCEVFNSSQLN